MKKPVPLAERRSGEPIRRMKRLSDWTRPAEAAEN